MLYTVIFHREQSDAITGFATVALTIVTAVLAAYTAMLARGTRESTLLSDRHHQEGLSPLIVLERANAKKIIDTFRHQQQTRQGVRYRFFARVSNLGSGASMSVRYRVTIATTAGLYSYPPQGFAIGAALAAGASLELSHTYEPDDQAPSMGLTIRTDEEDVAFEVKIEYDNVFGSTGSLHVAGDEPGLVSTLSYRMPPPMQRLAQEAGPSPSGGAANTSPQ